MSDILETLRAEHAQLLALAKELEASPNSWQIEAFKRQLLDHFEREDQQFYPQLEQAGGGDFRSSRIIDVFAKERHEVAKAASRYFESVAQPSSEDELVPPPDYRELLKGLHKRVLLADDSEEIAAEVLRFFDSIPEVLSEPAQPSDFRELIELLRDRIHKEETVLFRLYEQLCPL